MNIKEIRLGNLVLPNNVFMAPLAGYTSYPFRRLCYDLGAGLCFTEMVNSNSLRYNDQATKKLLRTDHKEKIKAVQLLGGDPRIVREMVKSDFVTPFSIIDLNMGCPVPNVVKSGLGSALLADPKRAEALIKACKTSGKIVTVKIRIGLTEDKFVTADFVKMCENAGADMVIIHGRSRNMMYKGEIYYDEIGKAKAVANIPIIANGGIFSTQDADKVMERTGADGIMIGRYALENPLIFSLLTQTEVHQSISEILDNKIQVVSGLYNEIESLDYMKKLIGYMMRGQKSKKRSKQEVYQCGNLGEIKEMIQLIFGDGEGLV